MTTRITAPIKPRKRGSKWYARDYREIVAIVAVERAPSLDDEDGAYTIKRPNGVCTFNYPGYLLRRQ